MKTFLILVNNAPAMGPYHEYLGQTLEEQGHKVVYAYSDKLPIVTYDLNIKQQEAYIFSEYFKKNYSNLHIDPKYAEINLWETLFTDYDRSVVNYRTKSKGYEYYNSLLINLVNFFDEILTKHKVDFFLYENISNTFAYICYKVAGKLGVGYYGYCQSRLPGRFEIQNEVFNIVEKFSRMYDELKLNEVDDERLKEIDAYIAKYSQSIPTYHSTSHPLSYTYPLVKKYFNKDKFRMFFAAIKMVTRHRDELYYSFQIQNPVGYYLRLISKQLKRKVKIRRLQSFFEKPVKGEQYFLLPLQMKPESSTNVWARHFVDEVTFIKNIAFNLPLGTKLYVKEHFVNLGNLPLSIYRDLKKIPNVKLLHPLEVNKPLLDNARGVITLTSTMGFEALMMGKTVIVFGDVFYKKHPAVINLKSFENLHEILNSVHGNGVADINISRRFLAAYYKCTFPGNMNFAAYPEFTPENFAMPFTNAINQLTAE